MTKVRGVLIHRKVGYRHVVEYAIRTDGSQPAQDFLKTLKSNAWPNGIVDQVDPDARPADVYYQFISRLKHLARTGHPVFRGACNWLPDGLWDAKADTLRIPFFDVDENGKHTKKNRITDRRTVDPDNQNEDWMFPTWDTFLRLTHGFPKTGDFTENDEIELAKKIRDEDLQND